jgi:TetR/AcrR family transcriptional regulator, transcriptional repressor for nem operon
MLCIMQIHLYDDHHSVVKQPLEVRDAMGHSQAEKAKSRERILEAAARQIREDGLDSINIAELMKAANLTHGGFYGHFASRDALVGAALERALQQSATTFAAAKRDAAPGTVKSIVNRYLSPAHRDDPGGGCAIAALAADAARSGDNEVRRIIAERLEHAFELMTNAMGENAAAHDAAISAWCTMVGAITLSRVFGEDKRGDDILKLARRSILDLEARVREARSK